MCGRAGRRGIDSQGNIFLMMGDKKNPPNGLDIVNMLKGQGTQVESKFRLSYKTIISFLSRNVKNILEFFKESYLENNKGMIMPQVIKKMNELKDNILKIGKVQCIYEEENEDFIKNYHLDILEIRNTRKKLFEVNYLFNK
jgi:adenosinetriphosphatase